MRTRARNSVRPSIEPLEPRDNPAGTVTATFAAGQLTVTGDAADNSLLLTVGLDDRLTISGNGSGTVVRLNGGPAGEAVTLPTPLIGAVNISLGDGADDLTIDAADLPASLTINGGNGDPGGTAGNSITLKGGIYVGGSLSITNLAGADITQISGVVNVEGNLTVRNGPGGSLVSGDDSTDLRVAGALTFAGGAGFDKVDFWSGVGVSVGSLAFRSGADRDGSYFRVHPSGDLSIVGAVRVSNGSGEDRTNLGGQNMTVGGGVVIQNGDGGSINSLLTQGTLSVGQVAIANGAGEDHNGIHSFDTAVIRGNVSFVNGAGDSNNYVGDGNQLSVGGNISFVNGAGNDVNSVGSGRTHVTGSITVRNANGGSDTAVTADMLLTVGGATRITSAAGKDLVYVGQGRVPESPTPAVDVGSVLVGNGDGGSDTIVLGTRLAIRGSVAIGAWDGTDQAIVGSVTDGGSVAGSVAIDIGPGDEQFVAVGAPAGGLMTIGRSLGIWTGNGAGLNSINLSAVNVRSWTDIVTGDGTDEIQITSSTFGGEFYLDAGAADDVIKLEMNDSVSYFRGQVWVYAGEGNDQVWLTAEMGGDLGNTVFAAATAWDGGGGIDFLIGRNFGGLFYGPEPEVGGYEATV